MKKSLRIILLLAAATSCRTPSEYSLKLTERLEAIRKLPQYDNTVVVYNEDDTSHIQLLPWTSTQTFYEGDQVTLKGKTYEAIIENVSKYPATSPSQWFKFPEHHNPYYFLRDTATTDDLKMLLSSDHPYIRTYSFAALAHRGYDSLYNLVVEQLRDTIKIQHITGDYGYTLSPADLMLQYAVGKFSNQQKDILKKLILTKYNHLNTLREVLLFHQPDPEDYQHIRRIIKDGVDPEFALVALARYCRQEDMKTIKSGFTSMSGKYFSGLKIFFKGIEYCPNQSFLKEMMDHSINEQSESHWIDEYYACALASYKNKECLLILKRLANQKSKYKEDNLKVILKAVQKYDNPLFTPFIEEIKKNIQNKIPLELNSVEQSPWNY